MPYPPSCSGKERGGAAEEGQFTAEELDAVRRLIGLSPQSSSSSRGEEEEKEEEEEEKSAEDALLFLPPTWCGAPGQHVRVRGRVV